MRLFRVAPLRIQRTGDDTPARHVYHYIWRMSGTHQLWVSLIAAAVAVLSMAPLELQRRIINDAVGDEDVQLLLMLGTVYIGVIVVESAGKFLLHVYQSWLSESAVRYNREHLAELQLERGDNGEEGRAVSIINSEIDKLGGFVGEGISEPVVNIGMIVTIITYMLVVEPEVALLALAFLAPQVAIAPWLQRRINLLNERRLGLLRDMSDQIVERAEGDRQSLLACLDTIYRNHLRIYVLKFLMKAATNVMAAMAPVAILLVGGYFVMTGETTIGVVVAFISGFQRLAEPLSDLLTYYRTAAQANVQHRMIAEWMRDGPQPRRPPQGSDGGIGDSPLPDDAGGPDAPAGSSAAFRSS